MCSKARSARAADRARITAQLIEAGSGAHLWADRFDGSLAEIFELQDRVASSVAGVIEPALHAAEAARSAGRPTADLTAYDLYLRALRTDLVVSAANLGSTPASRTGDRARPALRTRARLGRVSAVFGCFLTAAATIRRRTV